MEKRHFLKCFSAAAASSLLSPATSAMSLFSKVSSGTLKKTDPQHPAGLQYCVIDPRDGAPLLSHASKQQRQPASLTKMATLAIVFEAFTSHDTKFNRYSRIKLPEELSDIDLSDLARLDRIQYGRRYPAMTLFKAVGARSCAVSTLSLANHLGEKQVLNWGGTFEERIEKCVTSMNTLAQDLGMKDTIFHGVTGDKREQNISTPYDIGLLVSYMQKTFPDLCEAALGDPWPRFGKLTKKNFHASRAIRFEEEIKWAKTGFTDPAGFCEADLADINGQDMVIVLFGAKNESDRRTQINTLVDQTRNALHAKYNPQGMSNNSLYPV